MTVIPEAGKRYVCRDGSITEPLKEVCGVWLVARNIDPGFYTPHPLGWRVWTLTGQDHPKDLMREYVE
jgi:hypothetical protein